MLVTLEEGDMAAMTGFPKSNKITPSIIIIMPMHNVQMS